MIVLNGDRQKVARWINQQFRDNSTFPSKCVRQRQQDDSADTISPQHLRAYREWGKTPVTGDALSGWIDQWLNEQDQQLLLEGIGREPG